jgi:hypothetical protein
VAILLIEDRETNLAAGIEGLKTSNTLVAQVITVSAALLAFTVTFAEKFSPKDGPISPPLPLKISWLAFAVTILLAFWALMAITGTMNELDRGREETNPKRSNIRIPAVLTFLSFFIGVASLIVAGWQITN